MVSCDEIKEYLDTKYNYKSTLSSLSNNDKIKSLEEAYDFDKIKRHIYKDNCTSADALLIKKNINLIEFKTGFDGPDETIEEKTKKENLRLKIQLKAYHSLHLLQMGILDVAFGCEPLDSTIKTIFCAVIDSSTPVIALDAYTDLLAEEASISNDISIKKDIYDSVMKMYRKETDEHKRLFYDNTFVFYDYEFDQKCSILK